MMTILRSILVCVLFVVLLCDVASAQRRKRSRAPEPPAPVAAPVAPEPMIVVVNGDSIPYRLYDNLVSDRIAYKGEGAINQSTADALFLQLIDIELIHQEAARRGISVSEEEGRKILLERPPQYLKDIFTDENGVFKRELFKQVILHPELIAQLAAPGSPSDSVVASWKADINKVIAYLRNEEVRRRVAEAMYKEKPLTDNDIRFRYFAENTRLNGSFVRVLHSTIPDSLAPVSEEEARKWYDAHLEDYRVPPSRSVSSLILPVNPLASDSAIVRGAIRSAQRTIETASLAERSAVVTKLSRGLPPSRIPAGIPLEIVQMPEDIRDTIRQSKPGDLIGPIYTDGEAVMFYVDSTAPSRDTILRARHVLLKVRQNNHEQDSANYQLALALKESIPNDSVFAEAAKFYSQDGSAKAGGDLGYFSRGQMVHEFDSAAFAANVGEVIGPVRTEYGYHLIRVTERVATSYYMRELRFPIPPSSEAVQAVRQDLDRYAEMLRKGEPTNTLLDHLRAKYPTMLVDTSLIKRLEPYGDALAANRFAFNASVGDVGIIELPSSRLMALKVLKIWPHDLLPYSVIRDWPIAHARRAKQLDMLAPHIKQIADSIKPTMLIGPLRELAPMAEVFLLNDQNITQPPEESKTLLDTLVAVTPANHVCGPVRGVHGFYFLRVVDRDGPSEADYRRDRAQFAAGYTQRYKDGLIEEFLKKTRNYAEVDDLRPDVYSRRVP